MKPLINSFTASIEKSMEQISFSTLIKMIKEGDAPSEIIVNGETYTFDDKDYRNEDYDRLTGVYTLAELSNMTFIIK